MPHGRIRIIAWAASLAVLVVFALRSGRVSPETAELPPAVQVADSEGKPQLLRIAGPLERVSLPRPTTDVAPDAEIRAAAMRLHSLKPRDVNSLSSSVVREPGAIASSASPGDEPQGYALKIAPASEAASKLPLELLLNQPKREEAAVAPRVSREMPSGSPPPSPLPIISTANPAMQPVHDRARAHVVRGFSLGDRSALYAARTEFIQALRTIAQAVDAQAGLGPQDPQACSQALSRGLHALSEADDFAPAGSRLDGDLDLAAMIEAHRTPACKQERPATQLAAMQAYFDYARDQLTRAAAASPVASQALTGLGKSYTAEKNQHRLAGAKAMVFHQAASATDANNHLAANELGVLLAQYGQWEQAKQSFVASLRVSPDAATWQNLAAVHAQLGEAGLARLAQQERQRLAGEAPPNMVSAIDGKPTVEWVEPHAFAGPPEEALAGQMKTAPPAGASTKPATATAQKSDPWSWLPWR